MKTLLVLRHAKADRSDPSREDVDRPLTARGEADATRMGTALAALEAVPEMTVTSPARRARDTAHRVATAMGYQGRIAEEPGIYEAHAEDLLAVVQGLPDEVERVLLVGHNPGMENLVSRLVSDDAGTFVRLPTGALACITLDMEEWEESKQASGTLAWLLTPRIVAPLLAAGDAVQ